MTRNANLGYALFSSRMVILVHAIFPSLFGRLPLFPLPIERVTFAAAKAKGKIEDGGSGICILTDGHNIQILGASAKSRDHDYE